MSAKILSHPAGSGAGIFGRRTRWVSSAVSAGTGVSAWFYWFAVFAAPAALLLGSPFNLLVLVVLWAIYLYSVVRYPEQAIFVFLVAMALIKLTVGPATSLVRGLNSDTIFILTLALCAVFSKQRQQQPPVANPYVRPLVFFSLVLSVSAVVSFGTASAQMHSFSRGWYPYSAGALFTNLKTDLFYLFLAPIAFRLIWNRGQVRAAVSMVAIYSALISIEALQSRSHETFAPDERIPKFVRAAGAMFMEPNNLGGFLAIVVLVLLPVFLRGKLPFKDRILLGASLTLSMIALVYSFSRGAWLSAAAGFAFLGLLRGAKGIVVLALVVGTATLWMPQAIIDRYEHTVKNEEVASLDSPEYDGSTESRIARWRAVPDMWSAAPFFGHGYFSFGRVYGVLNLAGHNTGPHSTITQLLIEEGLIGIAGYLWIMAIMFWGAFCLRSRTNDPLLESLATGVCAGVPTLGLLDLTGNRFLSDGLMGPMWLLIAGVTRQYWNLKTAEGSSPDSGSAPRDQTQL